MNLEKQFSKTGIYQAIVVAAKRARQIHNDIKIELNQRLETLAQLTQTVESDEEFETGTNPDQLKISLEFEERAKPSEYALQELAERKIGWRRKEEEKPAEEKEEKEEKEEESE